MFGKNLRRVKKADVGVSSAPRPSGLEECLECWKLYMMQDDRDLSAPRMRLLGGADDAEHVGYESDPYQAQFIADVKTGEIVNAIIMSMTPIFRRAVEIQCGIASLGQRNETSRVWPYPEDLMEVIQAAQKDLESRLRRNIVTAVKF